MSDEILSAEEVHEALVRSIGRSPTTGDQHAAAQRAWEHDRALRAEVERLTAELRFTRDGLAQERYAVERLTAERDEWREAVRECKRIGTRTAERADVAEARVAALTEALRAASDAFWSENGKDNTMLLDAMTDARAVLGEQSS